MEKMSTQCRYFVQHAWKQNLCANCFETREEHERALKERLKKCNVSTVSSTTKNSQSIQSILRRNRNDTQLSSDLQRKNVAFLDSLTEVIGYGGDDNYDEGSDNEECLKSNDTVDKIKILEEFVPDSEEDRALNNLTRENTNFNRIIENLTNSPLPEVSSTNVNNKTNELSSKTFGNLMLGNIKKNTDGKKTTLIVSVTPFQSESSAKSEHGFIRKQSENRIITKESKDIIVDVNNDHKLNNITCENISSNNYQLKDSKKPLLSSPLKPISDKVKNKNIEIKPLRTNLSKNNINNNNIGNDKQSNCDNTLSIISEKKKVDENSNIHDVILYNKPAVNLETEVKKIIPELEPYASEKKLVDELIPPISNENLISGINNQDNNDNCDETCNKVEILETTSDSSEALLANDDNDNSSTLIAMPRSSFLHGKIDLKSEPQKTEMFDIKSSTDDITKLSEESSKNIYVDQLDDQSITESLMTNSDKQKNFHLDEYQMNDDKNVPKFSESSNYSSQENSLSSVYTRKPVSNIKSDCPVVREKEKRERNHLCNQKLAKSDDESLNQYDSNISNDINEKTDSLRSQECSSLSDTECSLAYYSTDPQSDIENLRVNKKKSKTQYFLKKFLRIGASRREVNLVTNSFHKETDNSLTTSSQLSSSSTSSSSHVKPRPKISHPHKLDGTSVQVLRHKKLVSDLSELSRISNAKNFDHADNFDSKTLTAHLKDPLSTNKSQLPESNCLKSLENNSSTLLPSSYSDQEDSELSNILKEADNPSWRSLTSGLKMKNFTNESVFVDSGKFRSIQCN
ncbi:dentin sialophosphoprotein [Chelonus insularis]|uniref:dentin sialophosphoprotein n=1 Tax=Chelonus insularis TaxID=460826 RepID=UPI00158E7340|nr:dentin sialophosphoprotein [Chelonus insularis]XP_034937752.1 dentin sialophosphoprotein [Chelonus insularis]